MYLRKKILSTLLLAIYLLAVIHNGVTHPYDTEISETPISVSDHQHNDFDTVHHEHKFHVGIFHFLGHFFENIDHSDDHRNEHVVVVQKTPNEKVFNQNKNVNLYTTANNMVVVRVDAKSLSEPPPYYLFLLHRLKQRNTPLRAPPALV